jgi:hypothetical protein
MNASQVAQLPDRGAVRVAGRDAVKLLQGLVTNDVEPLTAHTDELAFDADAAYAALLSPQGKILFDFFCVRTPEGFILDVARDQAGALVKRLSMYKLRAEVDISDVSDGYELLALWGKDAVPTGAASGASGTLVFRDPRHEELGTRIMAEARFATEIASATNGRKVDASDYHAHRISIGVPEGGKDFAFADTFPHEALLDQLNGVSFTKGCYVGQEIVSRMEHRGTARKRIVPIVGAAPLPDSGAAIMAGQIAVGTLGSTAGTRGLAMIRLDRAHELSAKGAELTASGIPIRIALPPWARFSLTTPASQA